MPYIVACTRPVILTKSGGGDPRPPRRSKIRAKDVELAIQQATNLCFNFEDTTACRVAWDRVEELSSEYARQRYEIPRDDPLETREYDV
jgi:hypothetical protein